MSIQLQILPSVSMRYDADPSKFAQFSWARDQISSRMYVHILNLSKYKQTIFHFEYIRYSFFWFITFLGLPTYNPTSEIFK